MNPTQLTHKKDGFSMIEVLMALVVVGLVLTAVAGMITNSTKARADARYRQVANEIAQDFIEKCRQEQALNKWSDFTVSGSCIAVSIPVERTAQVGLDYSMDVTITANNGPPQTKTVNITVSWDTGRHNEAGVLQQDELEFSQVFTNRN